MHSAEPSAIKEGEGEKLLDFQLDCTAQLRKGRGGGWIGGWGGEKDYHRCIESHG